MKDNFWFRVFFIFLFILTFVATVFRGLSLLLNDLSLESFPTYIGYFLVSSGVVAMTAIIFILCRKRIGVYVFPAAIVANIIMFTEKSLFDTVSLIFVLFLFTGYGLVFIIPKWEGFK